MSRAARRSLGKRQLRREARRDVTRVIELADEGRSAGAIAASVGLPEAFVREILERAEAVRSAAGEAGEAGDDVPPAA